VPRVEILNCEFVGWIKPAEAPIWTIRIYLRLWSP